MKAIFDAYIDNAFDGYHQAEFKFKQFEINYKKYFPSDTSSRVLDIGIGRGEMLSCMKKWGYANYEGVDISPSTVGYCRTLGLNCVLVDDTKAWLSDKGSQFDVITLLDVLEHFEKNEVIPFLETLFEALKPGGRLIIQVPNLQSPDGVLHRYNDFTHNIGFIEHSLAQVLITAGIRTFCFYGFEEITAGGPKAMLKKTLRGVYWSYCRFVRKLNTNLNPAILNPVFYAVVTK